MAKYHIDAAVMNLVRWPERFDVVVASNLFGDILTDLSGILAGGLGQAPSSNINPERCFPSMFEPVHGSAPDIAGQGVANPTAAILSGANMLRWLGEERAAAAVEQAVEVTFAQGHGTPDLGGDLNTQVVHGPDSGEPAGLTATARGVVTFESWIRECGRPSPSALVACARTRPTLHLAACHGGKGMGHHCQKQARWSTFCNP